MHAGRSVCAQRTLSFQQLEEAPQRSPRQSGWGLPLLMSWRNLLLPPGGAGWSGAGSMGQQVEQRQLGMSCKRRRRERKLNVIEFRTESNMTRTDLKLHSHTDRIFNVPAWERSAALLTGTLTQRR